MMEQSIEELIVAINAKGWKVNNLFQRLNGDWQANLRNPADDWATSWANHETAVGALKLALLKIDNAGEQGKIRKQFVSTGKQTLNLTSVEPGKKITLADLGLT